MNPLEKERREKLEKLRGLGVPGYGGKFAKESTAADLVKEFVEGKQASVAGRITALRRHGKTIFADLRDATGKIQLYFRAQDFGEQEFQVVCLLDVGDVVGAEGAVFKTRTGEVTLNVRRLQILAKSILPLPEKWHGLKDTETRFRKRYLDLLVNPEVRDVFRVRAEVVREVRRFLEERGFMEVETPMMHHIPGGAVARPFVTHHNALGIDLYLRIAPELFLKKLLVGGFERVYELNRTFRNEGIDRLHNPEFTMLEAYQAYGDYNDMMALTEEMVCHLAKTIVGGPKFVFGEQVFDVTPPWPRLLYHELLKTHAGLREFSPEAISKRVRELGLDAAGPPWVLLEAIFKSEVEPKLEGPLFVIDYPAALSPLAKRRRDDPDLAERFEPFVAGFEIGNGYSELNDPTEQMARFVEQSERTGGPVDEDFVEALKQGMPPAGGLGIGVDRVVMLLANCQALRDVILFPLLRPEGEAS